MASLVVLDGFTLNPGDLSWAPLQELADCRVYDRTAPEEIVPRARGAALVLTNKTVLSRETIAQLPDLRYIGVLATGYNVVDLAAAHDRKITITNVPSYGTTAVAQMVFAHLLNFFEKVEHHAVTVREGRWSASPDFCYWDYPLRELAGRTMGILGFGRIGRAVARIAAAFDMQVLTADQEAPGAFPDAGLTGVTEEETRGVHFVMLDELFRLSDVLSLHCPLTRATRGIVSRERLALMKPDSILVNTARGPLVDEIALAEALHAGRIAGACLDVLAAEPPAPDHPLLSAPHCQITPHIAWATAEARRRLLNTAAANVRAFLAGAPVNLVPSV